MSPRTARSSGRGQRLRLPALLSLAVHVALVVGILLAARPGVSTGTVYAVNLVAAPAGPRQTGIVNDAAPLEKTDVAPPKRAETTPKEVAPIRKPTKTKSSTSRATQTPDAKSARFDPKGVQKAGGGPVGGQGTDVAGIKTEGEAFPYPAYLQNIVNQIALRFDPRQRQVLRTDVRFFVRRDGSVFGISVVKGSGVYGFDLEAKGAVESAASANAFGPLPEGYADDVLTVIFSFDPTIIR